MTRAGISLVAIVALSVLGYTPASAHDDVAWKAEREGRFAAVKAALPPQDATIATIKSKTAAMVSAYRAAPGPALQHPPVVWRTAAAPVVVFDTAVAPRMVVVPAGEYTIGSPDTEAGRQHDEKRRRVRLNRAFAVSMFPITYGEYSWFVHASGHKSATACTMPDNVSASGARDWLNPGFPQTPRSPVTCVAYADAQAYVRWLAQTTGHRYRLLSDAEYEYAARGGTTTAYWWGEDFAAGCAPVNSADACDPFAFTVPLDKSKANAFGLFDVAGNVGSWTSDCWHGNCAARVVRGGSWATPASDLRAAARVRGDVRATSADRGFRVARDL
ncbi:SUMF1/EgtB/PvdO family nonheme iron enzyme [Sphingomonas sp.]|uniref:formylglycine-generating enzyme family protein n=1 Tax=Sphingomonas sp. TaxID=28214 RepID=UPI0025EB9020|nr:SUMF1/EgtB/PvdO family nonheme iron enzyme [Sphingomonas sp.]